MKIQGVRLNMSNAKKVARALLKVEAVRLNVAEPFTFVSGIKSPIYCDNRTTLSFPPIRNYLRENLANLIEQEYGKPDVIAGVATGAIAIGVLVAQHLNVPFVYVRPEPKSHGRKNQVEGLLEKNKNVVVVEDLISTGKSSLNAVQALKDEGANVKGMVAIFSYGFEIANENFSKANVKLNTLSDYNHLLEQSLDSKYISEAELDTLKKWRENPSEWGLINS